MFLSPSLMSVSLSYPFESSGLRAYLNKAGAEQLHAVNLQAEVGGLCEDCGAGIRRVLIRLATWNRLFACMPQGSLELLAQATVFIWRHQRQQPEVPVDTLHITV